MTALFAIAVPIGSWHPLLRDCLQSLIAQGAIVEIAALDASGDDRVKAVLDEYDAALAYRRTGPDKGQSDAIIEGWNKTGAPILGWLNADDALYPGALKTAAARFSADPALDLVYGDSTIIDDDHAYSGYHWAVAPPSEAILSGCIISQPSCFFKREAVAKIGGLDADLHYTMDWDLWVRLWQGGARFDFIDETLSRVLWSGDAKTGGFNRSRRKELERIIAGSPSLIRRAKSRVGFALHHFLEFRAPASLARAVREKRRHDTRIINGFARTGLIEENARLRMVYYGENNGLRLRIRFAPGASGLIRVADASMDITDGDNEIDLPETPGSQQTIDLSISANAPTTFISARIEGKPI
ncbi:MAG: glycosyltransferase [Pseudomonadota bacterium]